MSKLKFLGMVRNLIEGGKPELVYEYTLDDKLDEVLAKFDRRKKNKETNFDQGIEVTYKTSVKSIFGFRSEDIKNLCSGSLTLKNEKYNISVVTSYALYKSLKKK